MEVHDEIICDFRGSELTHRLGGQYLAWVWALFIWKCFIGIVIYRFPNLSLSVKRISIRLLILHVRIMKTTAALKGDHLMRHRRSRESNRTHGNPAWRMYKDMCNVHGEYLDMKDASNGFLSGTLREEAIDVVAQCIFKHVYGSWFRSNSYTGMRPQALLQQQFTST